MNAKVYTLEKKFYLIEYPAPFWKSEIYFVTSKKMLIKIKKLEIFKLLLNIRFYDKLLINSNLCVLIREIVNKKEDKKWKRNIYLMTLQWEEKQ